MKKSIVALLFCSIAASAVEIVNFDNAKDWYLNAHIVRRQTWKSVAETGKNGGNVAVITISPSSSKANFMEFYLSKPMVIAANEAEFSKRSFVFDTCLSKARDVWAFAIRCRDAKGEYFQFTAGHKLTDHKWETFVMPLAATSWNSWGGNNDKKIDYPLTLLGFVPTYTKTLKEPLTVKIHGVCIEELE